MVPGRQPLAERLEELRVVVPPAIVERDEWYAGLDQPAGKQGSLAEGGAAVPVTNRDGLPRQVKRGLGLLRAHELGGLEVVLVQADSRVTGLLVQIALKAVHLAAQ